MGILRADRTYAHTVQSAPPSDFSWVLRVLLFCSVQADVCARWVTSLLDAKTAPAPTCRCPSTCRAALQLMASGAPTMASDGLRLRLLRGLVQLAGRCAPQPERNAPESRLRCDRHRCLFAADWCDCPRRYILEAGDLSTCCSRCCFTGQQFLHHSGLSLRGCTSQCTFRDGVSWAGTGAD